MSEKLEKLRAMLEKEKERRIKLNNRIEILERRIQEAEAAEVNEMVRSAKVSPEQLAALLRQSANTTPNPAALAAVGATFDKEEDVNDEDALVLEQLLTFCHVPNVPFSYSVPVTVMRFTVTSVLALT